MKVSALLGTAATAALLLTLAPIQAGESGGQPSVAEQIQQLQESCSASAAAREQRQAEKPLYDRLGGYERIHDLTREIVRLHGQNEAINAMFHDVDSEALAKNVADFMAAGTGGAQQYHGRDMVSTHAHLHLTDADFLAAGGDIVKAMQSKGYGPEEIDEVVCILVSLKDQVVLE